jgi:DNA-binding response OmpR family regulator
MKLLLIEDSERLRRSLGHGLRRAGFAVDLIADGREGLAYAEVNDYDVIILDLMLPGVDGLTVLRTLRQRGRKTHVLILSAKDQVQDRILGLELGADDYLVKPFSFEELCARVRALIRRRASGGEIADAASSPLARADRDVGPLQDDADEGYRPHSLPSRAIRKA